MNDNRNNGKTSKNLDGRSSSNRRASPKNSDNNNINNKNPKRRKKKKPKKSGFVIFKRIFLGLLIIGIIGTCAVLGLGFGIFNKIIQDAPPLDLISIEPNVYTSIVYDKDGKEIDRFYGEENREYVNLDGISQNLQDAIVSVEDQRFYTHFGIDIRGILRAGYTTIKNSITGSSGLQGASTITQQLIKNNITKVSRNTIETKLQEQYLAVMYEKKLTEKLGDKIKAKKYILELYLNTIALGHGYNGVQAASLGYFNKDAKDLTLAESACIAGITNNPSLYSPRSNPENNKLRVDKILNHMLEQEMISQDEYNKAIKEDIYSKVSQGNSDKKVQGNIIHSYFEDALFEQVSEDIQKEHNISKAQAENLIYSGGLQIYSTKDSAIQNILDETYLNDKLFPDMIYSINAIYTVSIENIDTKKQEHTEYREFVKSKEDGEKFVSRKRAEIEKNLSPNEQIIADKSDFTVQPQSAMIVIDYKTGNVVGIIGGRGDKIVNRGFNRATDSERQPGSVFKPLAAFAPAIDKGLLMPGSVLTDEAIDIGGYSPSNWYGEAYRGASTLRDAMRDSMNIIAVKAMNIVGVNTAYKYLKNFGFTTLEDDNHLSTALGGIKYGVTQLEVTAAFATIANAGKYYSPKFYTKVVDQNGKILLDATKREPKVVLKDSTAFLLTDMMRDVVTSGTGRATKFKSIKMPIAGKTGTTQETKDLTFVGYTPYYVAGIWFGYDIYDKTVPNMTARVGGKRVIANDRYPLNIWREAMERIHKNLKYKDFGKAPSNVIRASFCSESGMLPTNFCPKDEIKSDYFVNGTQPKKPCTLHQEKIAVCTESHKLAGDFCPKELVVYKTSYELDKGLSREDKNAGITNVPSEICDIHIENSSIYDPNSNNAPDWILGEEITEDTNSNVDASDNIGSEFESIDNDFDEITTETFETTTLPEEFGNIVPNEPLENLELTTETTSNAPESITSNVESTTIKEVTTSNDLAIELP